MTVKSTVVEAARRLSAVERVDRTGRVVTPRGARAAMLTANRRLIEAGRTPPWYATAEWCRRYWADADDGNAPDTYAGKHPGIVDWLHRFWQPDITPDTSVLELGCNAGANLHRLRQLGYKRLAGAEISRPAIDTMRSRFPDLADVPVTVGALEDTLPAMRGAADVVLTMAVLIHVHPSSIGVFEGLGLAARSHVCVIEAEHVSNLYVFPRRYRRLLERHGLRQVREQRITADTAPDVAADYHGYVARLFVTSR